MAVKSFITLATGWKVVAEREKIRQLPAMLCYLRQQKALQFWPLVS